MMYWGWFAEKLLLYCISDRILLHVYMVSINETVKLWTVYCQISLIKLLVPAAAPIYLARHDQKIWHLDYGI